MAGKGKLLAGKEKLLAGKAVGKARLVGTEKLVVADKEKLVVADRKMKISEGLVNLVVVSQKLKRWKNRKEFEMTAIWGDSTSL